MQVNITDILVEDRYRHDFGAIDELAESIRDQGLICPIAVETLANGKYKLLAGERRLRACRTLGMTTIPVRVYDEGLEEIRSRQIELEENIQRKDFSYMEECNLKREIHNLRLQIHGKKTSTAQDAPGWSLRDTAKLMDISPAEASRDIKLAETMEQFPEIDWTQFKTKNEAQKQVKKLAKTLHRQDMAEQFTKTSGNQNILRNRVAASFVVGDFLEMGRKLPDGFADFVEIDPPYGIDLNNAKRGGVDAKYDSYNEVDAAIYLDFMRNVLAECHRFMKPNAWLVCWFGPEPWFEPIYQLLAERFVVRRLPGLWVKPSGQTQQPNVALANCYEMFFYARKGNAELQTPGRSNVFNASPLHPSRKTHPTERPSTLITPLLETFTEVNAQVVVPFAGSGRTLIDAWKLKRQAVGYDLSGAYRNAFIETVMREFPDEKH